jgi:hypothetical protein
VQSEDLVKGLHWIMKRGHAYASELGACDWIATSSNCTSTAPLRSRCQTRLDAEVGITMQSGVWRARGMAWRGEMANIITVRAATHSDRSCAQNWQHPMPVNEVLLCCAQSSTTSRVQHFRSDARQQFKLFCRCNREGEPSSWTQKGV